MAKKKEFIQPTEFDVVLRHGSKAALTPVVAWLLKDNACHSFQWESISLQSSEVFQLSIQTSWADNLGEIAKLLGDYDQDDGD